MIVHAHFPLGETRVECEALALVNAGYSVDVICLRDHGEIPYEEVKGVGVYRLPVTRRRIGGLAALQLHRPKDLELMRQAHAPNPVQGPRRVSAGISPPSI